jgi:hypothetical protein
MWAAASKAVWVGLPKPFGVYITLCTLDGTHGLLGYSLALLWPFPSIPQSSLLEWECLFWAIAFWEYVICFLIFIGAYS